MGRRRNLLFDSITMKLLILCVGLLSLTSPCRAGAVCYASEEQDSYVTNLASSMAGSVRPDAIPDPSVLLALILGKVKEPTARNMLIEQLKVDAANKVSQNLPFTSGKVALYVLALRSSCSDPTEIPSSQGNINLVNALEIKTEEELKSIENNNSPLTTWYQVALDVLALCVMSNTAAIKAGNALANAKTCTFSVDTAAVAVMALTCVLEIEGVPPKNITPVKTSLNVLLEQILGSQKEGIIGNIYSTGLAGQALTAAQSYYPSKYWGCPQTLNAIIELIPKGKFSLPIAAAQVLPFLRGESYLSVKGIQCPNDDAFITVEYTILNELVKENFKHPITVSVKEGSTLLEVMQKAAKDNPKDFSFDTVPTSWGLFVTTINHLTGSTNEKTYWQFLTVSGSAKTPLEEGVGTYKPHNNEHILAMFSKY